MFVKIGANVDTDRCRARYQPPSASEVRWRDGSLRIDRNRVKIGNQLGTVVNDLRIHNVGGMQENRVRGVQQVQRRRRRGQHVPELKL